MFKIIFKISDVASKEAKRDFNIDQVLDDSEKIFNDIAEYNQYSQVIERLYSQKQTLNLDGKDYTIEGLKTITTSNLSEIILEVTVTEYIPIIDWSQVNKDWNKGGYSGRGYNTYYAYDTQSPYQVNIHTGSYIPTSKDNNTTVNTNTNAI